MLRNRWQLFWKFSLYTYFKDHILKAVKPNLKTIAWDDVTTNFDYFLILIVIFTFVLGGRNGKDNKLWRWRGWFVLVLAEIFIRPSIDTNIFTTLHFLNIVLKIHFLLYNVLMTVKYGLCGGCACLYWLLKTDLLNIKSMLLLQKASIK